MHACCMILSCYVVVPGGENMSCIQTVCKADDAELIKAHKGFHDWKKCNPMDRVKTDYSYALRHYVRYNNHI